MRQSVADLAGGEDINVGGNTESASFALSDNVWYAHDAPEQSTPALAGFRGEQWGSVAGLPPSFVDQAAGDYRVPAQGETYPPGTPVSCAVPTADR